MALTDSKKGNNPPNREPGSSFIIIAITILIAFFESIYILIRIIDKGITKKEVLSKKSNLGFDIEIRMKS